MDAVKPILLKAKNQLILAISAATAAFVGDVKVMAEQFSTDLDVNIFKGSLESRANDLTLSADLYPAQAEYELTDMVNGIVADYDTQIAALKAELSTSAANIEALNVQLANAATEKEQVVADLQAQVSLKETELQAAQSTNTALAGEVVTIKGQRDNYKQQYEAAIADDGVQLKLEKGSDQYAPPAGAPDHDEAEKATDPYAEAALALKRMKTKRG